MLIKLLSFNDKNKGIFFDSKLKTRQSNIKKLFKKL